MPHRQMSGDRLLERNALDMIKRRAKKAGLPDWVGNHVCRATGITRFLEGVLWKKRPTWPIMLT